MLVDLVPHPRQHGIGLEFQIAMHATGTRFGACRFSRPVYDSAVQEQGLPTSGTEEAPRGAGVHHDLFWKRGEEAQVTLLEVGRPEVPVEDPDGEG